MYATSATASSKPFGLFQDSGDSSKVPREATSQYTLRPRRRPRITQKSFPPASCGEVRAAVIAQRLPLALCRLREFTLSCVVTGLAFVQGMQKAVVAETPTSSADSSASVAHSAGTSGECGPYRKKRNDFEEQAELVDVLNMLSQMYRDQVCTSIGSSCRILCFTTTGKSARLTITICFRLILTTNTQRL